MDALDQIGVPSRAACSPFRARPFKDAARRRSRGLPENRDHPAPPIGIRDEDELLRVPAPVDILRWYVHAPAEQPQRLTPNVKDGGVPAAPDAGAHRAPLALLVEPDRGRWTGGPMPSHRPDREGRPRPGGWVDHSITRSARSRIDGGMVRPRAFAARLFRTSSNFVGCSTGRSAGLAPFKILSTKTAARRKISMRSAL